MKNYNFIFIYIYSIIFITGCKKSSEQSSLVKSLNERSTNEKIVVNNDNITLYNTEDVKSENIRIPSEIKSPKFINTVKLFSNIKMIPLETNDKSIIGNINEILTDVNNYFIHDRRNNKLLRFNNEGQFLNSIGTIGKGPKELFSIQDVAINREKKIISILDNKARKISRYTYSGKYINSQPLYYMVSKHEYLNDSIVFSVSKVQKNNNIPIMQSYGLVFANKKLQPLSLGFKNPKNSSSYMTSNPLRKIDSEVYYNHPFSNSIWKVKKNSLIPIIEFEFEKNGLPNDAWRRKISNEKFKDLLDNNMYFSGEYLVTDKFILFDINYKGRIYNFFFDRSSKSLEFGSNYKPSVEEPITFFMSPPLNHINEDSFISSMESSYINMIRNNIIKNKTLIENFNPDDLEKIMKVKESDNPVLITYKLKDF